MNGEAILDLVRIVVLLFILVKSITLIKTNKHPVLVRFFTLAIACIMLSDFYWLAYDILCPETRLPFAANEISEWAMFLLLGAALASRNPIKFFESKKEIIGVFLFSAANVFLWIMWSGEWAQDILTGLAMGYFLCALTIQLKAENSFTKKESILITVVCIVLILTQTSTFIVADKYYTYLDHTAYLILFATSFVLLRKVILSIKKASPYSSLCTSVAYFAWNVITMYMSADYFHLASMFLVIVSFAFMFHNLKKEVETT